jgi:putative sugar O-methyltransferase
MSLDDRIDAMVAELELAPAITRPSQYWDFLNGLNLRQLDAGGFDEFKRTINGNYFQWLPTGPRDPQFRRLLVEFARRPAWRTLSARLDDGAYVDRREDTVVDPFASAARRSAYAWFVASLSEYVDSRDARGLTRALDEPSLGNPLVVRYRGRRLSQDLCNSALEMLAIVDALPGQRPPDRGILELGGGYGRLAWMFLECFPSVRYLVVDIPPALSVAERYLSLLYPKRSRFAFRHFDSFEEVRSEFEEAQIAFLTPNQLAKLPQPSVGLSINVSSLHEMRPEQIAFYLATIDAHTDGHFYSKQWIRSVNPHDGVVIGRDDYPIPPAWSVVFDRRHPIQTPFFEALYATRPDRAGPAPGAAPSNDARSSAAAARSTDTSSFPSGG